MLFLCRLLFLHTALTTVRGDERIDSKPRVDTYDNHLRFVTPRNKDIEFTPGAGGHVILGGVHLDERVLIPVKGDKGDTGEDGTDGSDGMKGDKGVQGISVKGEPGNKGGKGDKGVGGLQGLKGDTGVKGDTGTTGTTGSTGSKGDKGQTGTAGRDGRDGRDGTNGSKGNKGSAGKDVDPNTLSALQARVKALEKFVNDKPPRWQTQSGLIAVVTPLVPQSVVLSATDPENGNVNYTLLAGQLPPSMSLNSATGIISGTVPASVIKLPTKQAVFTFTVLATDPIGKTATQQFTIRVEGYPSPDYDSGWFTFTAQQGGSSYKELSHNFQAYPARVQVLVKAIDGKNKDFIFNGVGCGVADDEADHYGGVAFAYDTTKVRLWAPDDNNARKNGGYVVAVEDGWGGEVNGQLSRSGSVRVLAWRNSPDGKADYQTTWTRMNSQAGSASFKEFNHGLKDYPAVCRVLSKAVDGNNNGFIFEAVGFATSDDDADDYGGLVFGYNSSSVRLWAPDANNRGSNGRIVFVADGWGGEKNSQSSNNADVMVQAWNPSNAAVRPPSYESKWFSISSQSGTASYKEITHNLGVYPSQVRVLVRARTPNNKGYYFEGFGAMTGDDELNDYGGLIFAYDINRVRIWVPDVSNNGNKGRIIPLYDGWGGEVKVQSFQSTKDTADVKVQAWL